MSAILAPTSSSHVMDDTGGFEQTWRHQQSSKEPPPAGLDSGATSTPHQRAAVLERTTTSGFERLSDISAAPTSISHRKNHHQRVWTAWRHQRRTNEQQSSKIPPPAGLDG